jgi:hypothetical protein
MYIYHDFFLNNFKIAIKRRKILAIFLLSGESDDIFVDILLHFSRQRLLSLIILEMTFVVVPIPRKPHMMITCKNSKIIFAITRGSGPVRRPYFGPLVTVGKN